MCLGARAVWPPSPAPTAAPPGLAQPKRLTILYTNDEHGWLVAQQNKDGSSVGGAAEMLGRWREQEGYTPDGPFLVLSGGDMWTGPAIFDVVQRRIPWPR